MAYSEGIIQRVWEKGVFVHYYSPRDWRKDDCGAWIGGRYYEDRKSPYGWEIDHIKPESQGGTDELLNMRPLQWENYASKKAGHPVCLVTASGNKNIRNE